LYSFAYRGGLKKVEKIALLNLWTFLNEVLMWLGEINIDKKIEAIKIEVEWSS
jgi:hypothetical protein